MTKEEAINVLKTRSCYKCFWDCDTPLNCHVIGGCDLKEATEIAIKALEAQGWISAKERLPDKSGWYIITYRDFVTKEKKANPAMFFDKFEGFDVIAWMPLPEVYRGGRDDT